MSTSNLHVSVASSSLPKKGHREAEYEDAYAVRVDQTRSCRAAVADGATESAYSGLWARLLVDAFAKKGKLMLDECRSAWERQTPDPSNIKLWYQAQKVEQGAHATFLGIEIQAGGSWRATSVGDCCLIHVQGGGRIASWPYSDSTMFHHQPDLISSVATDSSPVCRQTSGSTQIGDVFLLATDAVAAWLLEEGVEFCGDWEEKWNNARRNGNLRNDDCTLVQLTITS